MRFWARKEQRTIPDGGEVWPTNGWAPFAQRSPNESLQVADVFACVRVLAGAAGSLPLIPYRRTATGRVRLSSGMLYGLLQAPAPSTTQANLVGTAMAHLLLHGNAYLGKFRGSDGRLEQLGLLDPTNVTVELVAGSPVYTVTDPKTGRQSLHGSDDITHVRALSTDGLVGLSPLKECRLAVSYARGMSEFAEAFTRHGMRPSGFITVPSGMSQSTKDQTLEALAGRHEGGSNAHRVAILQGDASYTAMTGPLDDLQFAEQRRLSTAEICRIFGVPPWMVGASTGDSLTYSNAEQQQLLFVTHALRPWLVLVEQAVSGDPDLCSQNVYVEFLLDALLRADSATRADLYTKALDPATGWMTRAEVRRLENLEHDVTIATYPAYPAASVELRTRPQQAKERTMDETTVAVETEVSTDNESEQRFRGTLRVVDNDQGGAESRTLFGAFQRAGWTPGGGRTEIAWLDYEQAWEQRALTWTGSVDTVNAVFREAGPFGYDSRWAWPAFARVPVDAAATSVNVLTQTARTLPTATNVVRAIDAVTNKPESASTVTMVVTSMKQLAAVCSGVPNIMLAQSGIESVIGNDLRLSYNDGLDKLILDAIAASGFQAPGTDALLTSIRKCVTTIWAAGYNPDTVILTPAASETLDLLVSGISGGTADYVFGPGQFATGRTIFGMAVRISKTIAAPAVVDSRAFGKLYAGPVALASFEENAGKTNSSLVRFEGNAVFGVERQSAAVRIAAS